MMYGKIPSCTYGFECGEAASQGVNQTTRYALRTYQAACFYVEDGVEAASGEGHGFSKICVIIGHVCSGV